MDQDLGRLIVRNRHVAPMLSALLSGTNAGVRIRDADGTVVLEREAGGIAFERFPIVVEGRTAGTVEGDRLARAIAAVLSYALSREADKRSLAREALDRYRELNLVYQLAEQLSSARTVEEIAGIAVEEAGRLPAGGTGFLLLSGTDGRLRPAGPAGPIDEADAAEGIVGAVLTSGVAEEVNDVATDPRATAAERGSASLIVAPVVARGATLGVLGAASSRPVTYLAADLKLLAAIAAIVGPALAHATADEPTQAAAG